MIKEKLKIGVETNDRLEFAKKKDGFPKNNLLDLIRKWNEKDGVETNGKIEVGQKIWIW